MHDYISWVKKTLLGLSVPMSFISMMLEGGLVVMVIVGSLLLSGGRIGTQGFVLALILGGIFSSSFAKLATYQHYDIVFNQSMKSIYSVIGEESSERGNQYVSPHSGDIVFSNVSFSYTDGEEALSGIDLCF